MSSSTDNIAEEKADAGVDSVVEPTNALEHISGRRFKDDSGIRFTMRFTTAFGRIESSKRLGRRFDDSEITIRYPTQLNLDVPNI